MLLNKIWDAAAVSTCFFLIVHVLLSVAKPIYWIKTTKKILKNVNDVWSTSIVQNNLNISLECVSKMYIYKCILKSTHEHNLTIIG